MSRLTCKYDADNVLRDMCTFDKESNVDADDWLTCFEYCNNIDMNCEKCAIQKAFDKLAEYEDLEEQGLFLKLPCKVGTTVYVIDTIYECDNDYMDCIMEFPDRYQCERGFKCEYEHEKLVVRPESFDFKMLDNFNKIVFLTKEEAEEKLKELNISERN